MGEHWPLAVASGLIALAAALGLWQHDRAVEVAAAPPVPVQRVRTPVVAPAPATPEKADDPAPTQPVAPATPTQTRSAFAPAPAVVAPTPAPAPAVTATPAPAPAVVNPAPAPVVAAPVPNVPKPIDPPADKKNRSATLAALRADLQAKTNIAAMDTAGGGYALAVDGVRLEVKPAPNWNITIYNINPKTPEVESDKFKEVYQATIASLQIDMAPKPVESANGKTYLKTTSKLGSISLIRDPANGNSCVIGPIQQWVAPPATPAPAVPNVTANPAPPAVPAPAEIKRPAPAPAPVTKTPSVPPRPPATDANF